MAQLEQSYDANDLPKSNFEPVPAGKYECVIHSASVENTKNGGQMLKYRLDITGPTSEGRVVFGNVTLRNANPKAVEIGKQQLGDLIRACGIPRLTDSDQLVGSRVMARIGIDKSEEYGDKNKVNGIMPLAGSSPMPSGLGNVTQTPAQSEAPKGAKPAWAAPK
jgi:hypothetical protein